MTWGGGGVKTLTSAFYLLSYDLCYFDRNIQDGRHFTYIQSKSWHSKYQVHQSILEYNVLKHTFGYLTA